MSSKYDTQQREDALIRAAELVEREGIAISGIYITPARWEELRADIERPVTWHDRFDRTVTWRDRIRWRIVDALEWLRMPLLADRVDAFLWRFR